MKKLHVYIDELYPFYGIAPPDSGFTVELEVSTETAAHWKRALTQFTRAQAEMEAALQAAEDEKFRPAGWER